VVSDTGWLYGACPAETLRGLRSRGTINHVEPEDVTLALTILGDIRTDVRAIREELEDGEEEEESDNP